MRKGLKMHLGVTSPSEGDKEIAAHVTNRESARWSRVRWTRRGGEGRLRLKLRVCLITRMKTNAA